MYQNFLFLSVFLLVSQCVEKEKQTTLKGYTPICELKAKKGDDLYIFRNFNQLMINCDMKDTIDLGEKGQVDDYYLHTYFTSSYGFAGKGSIMKIKKKNHDSLSYLGFDYYILSKNGTSKAVKYLKQLYKLQKNFVPSPMDYNIHYNEMKNGYLYQPIVKSFFIDTFPQMPYFHTYSMCGIAYVQVIHFVTENDSLKYKKLDFFWRPEHYLLQDSMMKFTGIDLTDFRKPH